MTQRTLRLLTCLLWCTTMDAFSLNNMARRVSPKRLVHRRPLEATNKDNNIPISVPAIISKQNAYLLLLASIALECTGASLSKRSRDIHSLGLFGVACALNMTSMIGLNVVLSRIAVGTAYAAWGAIGTILVTAVGVLVFHEPWNLIKAVYLAMIATGVIGLNLAHS